MSVTPEQEMLLHKRLGDAESRLSRGLADAYARGLADGLREAFEAARAEQAAWKLRVHYSQQATRAISAVLTKLRRMATGAASKSKGEK